MEGLKFGTLVLCLMACTLVGADPTEYELTHFCGSDIYVYSSAILTAKGFWIENQDCEVQVYSSFHNEGDDKLRMEVLSLDIACGYNYVMLYDGDKDTGTALSSPLCGQDTDSIITMYISASEDYITFVLHGNYDGSESSLRMLATATAVSYQSSDFICDNNYDVVSYLQCDGYNNCGDWSDEHSYQCDNDDFMDWTWTTYLSAAAVIFFVLIGVAIIIIIVKGRRRRVRSQYQSLIGPNAGYPVQGPPAYGTIQAQGAMPQGYMPTPPPYGPDKNCAGALPPQPPSYYQSLTLPPAPQGAAPAPAPQVASPPQPATTTATATTATTVDSVTAAAADAAP